MKFKTMKELMHYCHSNDLAVEIRRGNTVVFSDGSTGEVEFKA